MSNEELLADLRNKLTPASHLIALVDDSLEENKTFQELVELRKNIKEAIPKAKESIEYVRNYKL